MSRRPASASGWPACLRLFEPDGGEHLVELVPSILGVRSGNHHSRPVHVVDVNGERIVAVRSRDLAMVSRHGAFYAYEDRLAHVLKAIIELVRRDVVQPNA